MVVTLRLLRTTQFSPAVTVAGVMTMVFQSAPTTEEPTLASCDIAIAVAIPPPPPPNVLGIDDGDGAGVTGQPPPPPPDAHCV